MCEQLFRVIVSSFKSMNLIGTFFSWFWGHIHKNSMWRKSAKKNHYVRQDTIVFVGQYVVPNALEKNQSASLGMTF